MVFNDSSWVGIIIVIVLIWLGVLTAFVVRMILHYSRMTKGVTKLGLREVLETVVGREAKLSERTRHLETQISQLSQQVAHHIQHIGIVRFNPFSDTGGSQSFSMALLDGAKNGIIVTSLYARTGNRWYVKEIKAGIGLNVELSKEEELAIKRAVEKGKK